MFQQKKWNSQWQQKVSKTFSEYVTNITKDLNLHESTGNINFENEESCKKLKESIDNENFSLEILSEKDVLNLIK